jgi:pimeloyl-ACP methyl ester carboxylesterase/DNA-binding CsgD family transcriptional regulator
MSVSSSRNGNDDRASAAALAVVEALYAFAEEPARWEDVLAAIDALPAHLDPAHDAIAASIVSHATRAAIMVERLNAGRAARGMESRWDAILLSLELQVRGFSGEAETRLAPFLKRAPVLGQALHLRDSAAQPLEAALASVQSDATVALAPFTLVSEDGATRCFGVVVARGSFPESLSTSLDLGAVWAEPLYAVVLLSTRSASGDVANRRLGLTAAEARLAAKLVQGLQIADAAAELGITAHTARTQLKNIFAKTGTRRQGELIQLLTDVSKFPAEDAARAVLLAATPPRRFVTLADRRQLFYREYGVESGPVVIYFHVGLAASLVIPEISRAAAKERVRLIAFERPGFGQSTPRNGYTFDGVAADVEELMQSLKISSVALFGDGYGGAFAVAAATRLNGMVRRLALRSPSLGRSLSNEGGSILTALFRQSWLIPGVMEIVHRSVRVSLIRSLARYYADRSTTDAQRSADPEFRAHFDAAVFDALEKTGAGLAAELSLFASGARVDPYQLQCPIAVWHGADHPGIPVSESVAAFANHPRATLHILPDTGSYLGQPAFDAILAWLADVKTPAVA